MACEDIAKRPPRFAAKRRARSSCSRTCGAGFQAVQANIASKTRRSRSSRTGSMSPRRWPRPRQIRRRDGDPLASSKSAARPPAPDR